MKKILRTFVLYLVALKATALITSSISFNGGAKTWLLAALGLTAFEYFLRPVAKILFLPINLITLGTLRWVINVIGLYLITLIVKGFLISPYHFPGLNWNGITVSPMKLSLLLTYIFSSLLINLIVTLFKWLIKK